MIIISGGWGSLALLNYQFLRCLYLNGNLDHISVCLGLFCLACLMCLIGISIGIRV